MPTFGTVPWRDIKKMLDTCAPGWRYKDKKHKRWLYYKAFDAFRLPLGPHGKREHHDIEIGHVKSLVRHIEIEACAKKHLRQL